jgi:hypothetical protein
MRNIKCDKTQGVKFEYVTLLSERDRYISKNFNFKVGPNSSTKLLKKKIAKLRLMQTNSPMGMVDQDSVRISERVFEFVINSK